MAEERFIGNRELSPRLVPAADADFSQGIYPFAMSYDGYGIWGDQSMLSGVSGRDWQAQKHGRLPASMTKLRTSLFGAGRAMRFIEFDEDIFGIEGSEHDWKNQMRELVSAIATQAQSGSATHLIVADAVATAARVLNTKTNVDERELRVALGNAIGDLVREPVASSATGHEMTFDALPLFDPSDAPGPFDVVVGDKERPRFAIEVKWSSKNTLAHSMWDVLKLLGVLALGAEQVYLVAGYPERVWRTAEFRPLYEDGFVSYTGLPLAKEWPWLLRTSRGTPLRIPNHIEISEVIRVGLGYAGEHWQLRAVAVDPAPGGWLELVCGRLEGAVAVS